MMHVYQMTSPLFGLAPTQNPFPPTCVLPLLPNLLFHRRPRCTIMFLTAVGNILINVLDITNNAVLCNKGKITIEGKINLQGLDFFYDELHFLNAATWWVLHSLINKGLRILPEQYSF